MKFGLRARVALAFALLSFIVAGVVAGSTYAFARWYLVDQRETAALTRAVLDSRAVDAAVRNGASPARALEQVPSVGTSQPMIRVDSVWFTAAITVPPDQLPSELLAVGAESGASQRADVAGDPYVFVAIPVSSGLYVEVFPLRELDDTLTIGGWALVILTAIATVVGALIGASTAGRLLVPVRRLGRGARQIASGELSTRIRLTGDADLDPIAESFNDMAEAVEQRIARESRFAANVSHELRSPITSILGTAELLESHRAQLPERDANLVSVLATQVRRMSQTLLDLLEISRVNAMDPLQWETADIAAACRDIAMQRGVAESVIVGDDPVIRTDARRFEYIVGNLLDNAQRHGGGVTGVVIEQDAEEVRVVVDDAGPGVPVDARRRVFEPFARLAASSDTDGAGLGLAIAQEQAAALTGRIEIADSSNGGARFILHLPIVPEEL